MKLQKIVAAVALLAAGAANAAVDMFDGVSAAGNGSLILVMADTTGTTTQGLTVDLGFHFADFLAGGALSQANQSVVWDFSANTISVNGSILGGITNDWADQFAAFAANSDAAETKWAVISGSQKGTTVTGFLTTGTPSASQLSQQMSGVTANMGQVNNPLLKNALTKGTLASADNGAYAMASTDNAYVGTAYSVTTVNGWKNNIKWSTWNVDGASTNFWQVNAPGTESRVADSATYAFDASKFALNTTGLLNGSGTLTLSGNTLTWKTASLEAIPAVPEPESYALALVGLAAAGFVARRRAAK
ncbi:PEP-CTERM sorting domain-containing protein [Aquabacterium sp.]|uniref:PEP-CTERM sorting domain-containing protein n=1 Tax=Aquabacterium sp. TaxID=1872578 RepID=UPI002E325CF5|nr:PEP-CTERM sorting domain-containing protein [Aquabacterium sp.]HEX5312057.1 PEP-CTERM sorting domain-containing protein [Aquabacterium sp.]